MHTICTYTDQLLPPQDSCLIQGTGWTALCEWAALPYFFLSSFSGLAPGLFTTYLNPALNAELLISFGAF